MLGRSDVGELAPGKRADLALFRLDELKFSGSHDPFSALLLCCSAALLLCAADRADRADRVMIGGAWRVEDGAIAGMDLPALIAEHSAAARSLAAG